MITLRYVEVLLKKCTRRNLLSEIKNLRQARPKGKGGPTRYVEAAIGSKILSKTRGIPIATGTGNLPDGQAS